MSEPIRLPCRICGQPLLAQPWMLIWGRLICKECQDYDPGEPGMFEQDYHDEEE